MSREITTRLLSELGRARAELEKARDEKLAAYNKAKDELAESIEELNQFNKHFAKVEAAPTRKKPGPKPGAKRRGRPPKAEAKKPGPKPKAKPGPKPKAAKAKPGPKPKAKPGPKPKAAKAKPGPKPKAAKVKKPRGKNTRAAAGRAAVARGDRPPIKEAVKTVLGSKTLNAGEILALIKAKNWTPNANDPKSYIAYILSANKDTFERVPAKGRGYYRVVGASNGKPEVEAKPEKPARKKPGPKPKAAKSEDAKSEAKSTDDILKEAGVGSGESIFTS